jgi:hypothetical protein
VRGRMLWFNETRGDGAIECEDGQSYEVSAADFVTAPPVGRCAGREVTFEAARTGRRAVEVRMVEDDIPRRARARRAMRGSP